jgi:hypothetical protein
LIVIAISRRPPIVGITFMRVGPCCLLIVFFAVGTAAPAGAEWVVTPYLGINVAGDAVCYAQSH